MRRTVWKNGAMLGIFLLFLITRNARSNDLKADSLLRKCAHLTFNAFAYRSHKLKDKASTPTEVHRVYSSFIFIHQVSEVGP
jgi:hypothetical protein